MYHLDEKQIQEITDYIFLEDKLEKADAIFIPVSYTHLDVYKRQVLSSFLYSALFRRPDKLVHLELETGFIPMVFYHIFNNFFWFDSAKYRT